MYSLQRNIKYLPSGPSLKIYCTHTEIVEAISDFCFKKNKLHEIKTNISKYMLLINLNIIIKVN